MSRLFSAIHWYTPPSDNPTFVTVSLFEVTCTRELQKDTKVNLALICSLPITISFTGTTTTTTTLYYPRKLIHGIPTSFPGPFPWLGGEAGKRILVTALAQQSLFYWTKNLLFSTGCKENQFSACPLCKL